jgi:hypothetical protein
MSSHLRKEGRTQMGKEKEGENIKNKDMEVRNSGVQGIASSPP